MLAQNFMTPTELGITDTQFDALLKVLRMLERGELVHTTPFNPTRNGFSMGEVLRESACGTAACICGWAHLLSDRKAFPQVEGYTAGQGLKEAGWDRLPKGLYELFFPWTNVYALTCIKTEEAALALRSYLRTGDPEWADALCT